MSPFAVLDGIKAVGGLLMSPITNMQKRKARKDELEQELHVKTLEKVRAGEADIAEWERLSVQLQGGTWKDEFVTVAIWLPFLTLFGASVVGNEAMMDRVLTAFEYMSKTPQWYQWVFLAVTGAAVGIKMRKQLK